MFIPIKTRQASRNALVALGGYGYIEIIGAWATGHLPKRCPRRARLEVSAYGWLEASFTGIKILTIRPR
jgi:hypothetical protein